MEVPGTKRIDGSKPFADQLTASLRVSRFNRQPTRIDRAVRSTDGKSPLGDYARQRFHRAGLANPITKQPTRNEDTNTRVRRPRPQGASALPRTNSLSRRSFACCKKTNDRKGPAEVT
jgi:hypothetical protein